MMSAVSRTSASMSTALSFISSLSASATIALYEGANLLSPLSAFLVCRNDPGSSITVISLESKFHRSTIEVILGKDF